MSRIQQVEAQLVPCDYRVFGIWNLHAMLPPVRWFRLLYKSWRLDFKGSVTNHQQQAEAAAAGAAPAEAGAK